jgi:hypothetical protein
VYRVGSHRRMPNVWIPNATGHDASFDSFDMMMRYDVGKLQRSLSGDKVVSVVHGGIDVVTYLWYSKAAG